jgi:hypothetical protein
VRQAYDFVVSEGSPDYYQEFIRLFPDDPLCVRVRRLLANWLDAAAWHQTVLLNSPLAYKAFYESHINSPYALAALKLQSRPKILPLTQPRGLILPQHFTPVVTHGPLGNKLEGDLHLQNGKIISLPAPRREMLPIDARGGSKIMTLPVQTVGKVTSGEVLKNDATSHVKTSVVNTNHEVEPSTDRPQLHPEQLHGKRHEDAPVKFKPTPGPVHVDRFHDNRMPTRPMRGGNLAPHFASTGGGATMGGGHRGFMR